MVLAINGGTKAVKVIPKENWIPPNEEIMEMIKNQVYGDQISGDWEGAYFSFEKEFKTYLGVKYACALNMGTSALWAAYYALGIKPNDEVICPSYTWVASITPAIIMGAKPIFCEIMDNKLVADPEDIRKRITSKTKAIVVVHIFGNVVDMDAIMAISDEYGIPVIEDCSHCHGAEWKEKKCGMMGHIGCFSLQGSVIGGKPIPAGEGGIVVTKDVELFNKIIFYTHMNRPFNQEDHLDAKYDKYGSERCGIKFRAHPLGLSIARIMLKSLDERNERKTAYRKKVNDALREIECIKVIEDIAGSKPAGYYGGMQVIYNSEKLGNIDIQTFIAALKAEGVNLDYRMYQAMHRMLYFQEGYDLPGLYNSGIAAPDYSGIYSEGCLPRTEKIIDSLIGMPVFIEGTENYFEQAISAFKKVVANYKELL